MLLDVDFIGELENKTLSPSITSISFCVAQVLISGPFVSIKIAIFLDTDRMFSTNTLQLSVVI